MLSLERDLQQRKVSLSDFESITIRVLAFLPNVISGFEEKAGYKLYYSNSAGTKKFVRPISQKLFILQLHEFLKKLDDFKSILIKIKNKEKSFLEEEMDVIDSVTYTMQQAIGAGFDLLVDPNSARKHVGNRFEELIKVLFTEIGVPNKKVIIKIPYVTEEGEKNYTCENDLILSPFSDLPSDDNTELISINPTIIDTSLAEKIEVVSPNTLEHVAEKYLNNDEVVVSVKTTSKDRMGKMFMDKILLEKFVGHNLKVIGIFLNDVQRKGTNNISYTLVSGLFMVYNQFITELEGVYYLDAPPSAFKEPYNKHIKRFFILLTYDLGKLLTP